MNNTKVVTFTLSEEAIAFLDETANILGVSPSELVEKFVRQIKEELENEMKVLLALRRSNAQEQDSRLGKFPTNYPFL